MRRILIVLSALAAACGGSGGSSTPPGPGPSPTTPAITISASGVVSPKELVVAPGTRVLFINNDTRRHDMTSDEHPDHQDCPAINNVGLLNPSQSRETGNLVAVRTCGYHDHENPDIANLKGRITIR